MVCIELSGHSMNINTILRHSKVLLIISFDFLSTTMISYNRKIMYTHGVYTSNAVILTTVTMKRGLLSSVSLYL